MLLIKNQHVRCTHMQSAQIVVRYVDTCELFSLLRFQVLTAVNMTVVLLRVVTSCRLVCM
jgi:hypothetical protein